MVWAACMHSAWSEVCRAAQVLAPVEDKIAAAVGRLGACTYAGIPHAEARLGH